MLSVGRKLNIHAKLAVCIRIILVNRPDAFTKHFIVLADNQRILVVNAKADRSVKIKRRIVYGQVHFLNRGEIKCVSRHSKLSVFLKVRIVHVLIRTRECHNRQHGHQAYIYLF